jgi:hypothetical protein
MRALSAGLIVAVVTMTTTALSGQLETRGPARVVAAHQAPAVFE